jgi:hypothetical protein
MHLCTSFLLRHIHCMPYCSTYVWRLPSISNSGCCSGRTYVNCIPTFQMFHHHHSDSGCPDEIWSCSESNNSWNVVLGKLLHVQLAARFLYIMGLSSVTLIRYTLKHYLFKIHFNISRTLFSFKVFKSECIHLSSSQRVPYVVYCSVMLSKNWGNF